MGERKTIIGLLDKEDVKALLSYYLFEVLNLTDKWDGYNRPWISRDEREVIRLLKKASECAERLDELERAEAQAKLEAEKKEREYENSAD